MKGTVPKTREEYREQALTAARAEFARAGMQASVDVGDWIENKNGDARVADGVSEVRVAIVDWSRPYIRTAADGKWTDNLLGLASR